MGTSIDYQKVLSEIVWVNLPGPEEPTPGMSGGELLHGFLAELGQATDPEIKKFVENVSHRWNVHYRKK